MLSAEEQKDPNRGSKIFVSPFYGNFVHDTLVGGIKCIRGEMLNCLGLLFYLNLIE